MELDKRRTHKWDKWLIQICIKLQFLRKWGWDPIPIKFAERKLRDFRIIKSKFLLGHPSSASSQKWVQAAANSRTLIVWTKRALKAAKCNSSSTSTATIRWFRTRSASGRRNRCWISYDMKTIWFAATNWMSSFNPKAGQYVFHASASYD